MLSCRRCNGRRFIQELFRLLTLAAETDAMVKFFLKKLGQGLLLTIASSVLAFVILSAAGGDALDVLRSNPQVSAETIEDLKRVYGLDRPLVVRYGLWLSDLVRGDLGNSIYFRTPVAGLVVSRLASTLAVGSAALALALTVSLLLGFAYARRQVPTLSAINNAVVIFTSSTPRLVLSLAGLAIAVRFGITSMFLLSAIVLAVPIIGLLLAQLQTGIDEVMGEDYIRTARAKGLSEFAVITRHASRALIGPVLTIVGLSIGALLAGSVLVESIFGRQGMGSLMVVAVRNRDVPLVMGVVVVASIAVWFGNTLAEFLQLLNDKRLRDQEAA